VSHNIEITKRGASIAFTGETPWHRLGQKIKEAFDAKTALKEARLDFTVEKTPIACADTRAVIPNRFAVRRTDTKDVLGLVGSSYTPCQNRDAFAFFDGVFGKDKARYECAGVLGKGERIWLLAKLPGNFQIGKDDVVNKFLLLTNSHDGSELIRARFTPIRVVCQNTLNAALREKSQEVGVMHLADVKAKLELAGKLLKNAGIYFRETEDTFRAFSKFKLGDKARANYFAQALTGSPDTRDLAPAIQSRVADCDKLHETGLGVKLPSVRGTLWGAYNALVEHLDHERTTDNLRYIAHGNGAIIKARAFTLARDLALAGN
jgi:phage/plasmid-like protein (TIGR03299 family)